MKSSAGGTNGTPNNPYVPDANVRRLYKTCVECVRKLDSCVRDKNPASRILSPEMTLIRHKLCESCEQLMFINPKEYGRKAEEQVWKKCFYEPIQILRQSKERMTSLQISSTLEFIAAGCGHYEAFLIKLQSEYPDFAVDLTKAFIIPIIHKLTWTVTQGADVKDPSRKWAQSAAIRTFIYLGDLSRYQLEFDSLCSPLMAERYYSIAACLNPETGMPFNQLGTLMTSENYGCDSLYFYLRCLLSTESFEGARGNLLQILKKNEKLLNDITSDESSNKRFSSKIFLSSYLHLVKVLYEDDAEIDKSGDLGNLCQSWLPLFDQSLLHLAKPGDILQTFGDLGNVGQQVVAQNKVDISVTVLLRLIATQILLVKQLQDKGSMKLSAAIALMLSILSHLLNNILMRFLRRLPVTLEEETHQETSLQDQQVDSDTSQVSPPVAMKVEPLKPERKRPGELMKKRRRGSQASEGENSSVESNKSQEDADDIHSEGETECNTDLKADSDVSDLDEPSDNEETNGFEMTVDAENNLSNKAAWTIDGVEANTNAQVPFSILSLEDQITEISEMGILLIVKVICDWLRCNPNLVVSIGQSSQALWSRLAEVLNCLPREEIILQFVEKDSDLRKKLHGVVWCPLSDWNQSRALVEDLALRPTLSQVHSTLDFSSPVIHDKMPEAILRIFCLRSFGHFLLRLNVPGFRYDRARQVFLAPSGFTTIEEVEAERAALKRELVAKTMADLRMQEELLHLEKVGWVPVFLVPDTSALANKLSLVEQLAATQKFVVAIPIAVIRELDKLKKESSSVREAMRWLETQFEQGTKFVRAQKPDETVETVTLQQDKTATNEVRDLLAFCAYLSRSVSESSSIVVTVITNHPPTSNPMQILLDSMVAGGLKGVAVENIHRFSNRWKNYRKKGV